MYYKKMVGEHVYLSPVNADEVDSYFGWMNEDKALSSFFSEYSHVISSKNDLNWLYEPSKNMHRYSIVLLQDDILIGSISLHNIDSLNRSAYIGIFIGDENMRSRGYGCEAVRLILDYGFNTMNLHSIKCYKNAGFREVGRLPDAVFKNGMYVDKILMSILENEYRA